MKIAPALTVRFEPTRSKIQSATLAVVCSTWIFSAKACPGPECEGGEVFPRSGVIPANHVKFLWQRTDGLLTSEDSVRIVKSTNLGDTAAADLAVSQKERDNGTVLLVAEEPLSPGDVVEVEYTSGTCDVGLDLENTRTTVTVGPEANTPTELGVMSVSISEGFLDYKGVCMNEGYRAYAELDVDFAEQAVPFADLFMLSVEVNGVARYRDPFVKRTDPDAYEEWLHEWPSVLSGRNSNDSKVLLSADCTDTDEEEGLLAGTYSVNLVGTLPDGTVLRTPSVELTLECERAVCGTDTWELDAPCPTEAGAAPILTDAGNDSSAGEGSAPSDAGGESTTPSESSSVTNASTASTHSDGTPEPAPPDDSDVTPPNDDDTTNDTATDATKPATDAGAVADNNDASDVNSTEAAKPAVKKRDSGCSIGRAPGNPTGIGALMLLASAVTLCRRHRKSA